MNPLHTRLSPRPRDALLLYATATAIALTVLLAQDRPDQMWGWLAITAAYVVIEMRAPHRIGAGWIAGIAFGAAVTPRSALAAAVLAAAASELVRIGRGFEARLVAGRIAAHVPPVAAFLVVVGGDRASATAMVLAGAVAGSVAFGTSRFVGRMTGAPPADDDDDPLAVGEVVVLGAAGALLGAIVQAMAWPIAPLAAAGLVIVASAETARRELAEARRATVATLLATIETKDLYTRGHSERVAEYAGWLGAELGLGRRSLRTLHTAALLHDIGKLVVPRGVLRKRGALTSDERDHITRHATIVPDLLAGVDALAPALPVVASHHLHFDGAGYGLGGGPGGALPVEARILAVADAFDAMTTHRPYRRALGVDYAIGELHRCAGSQFDPLIVAAFVRCLDGRQLPAAPGGFDTEEEARHEAEAVAIHV